jgi:hypothetical protein
LGNLVYRFISKTLPATLKVVTTALVTQRCLMMIRITQQPKTMNVFVHNIDYDKFNIRLNNSLRNPHFGDDKSFGAIVSNPP